MAGDGRRPPRPPPFRRGGRASWGSAGAWWSITSTGGVQAGWGRGAGAAGAVGVAAVAADWAHCRRRCSRFFSSRLIVPSRRFSRSDSSVSWELLPFSIIGTKLFANFWEIREILTKLMKKIKEFDEFMLKF